MTDGPPQISSFTAQQIARRADEALRQSGALGVLPTPIEEVGRAAGLLEVVGIDQLPADLIAQAPPGMQQVLGAVVFEERVAFIDRAVPEHRQRFTELHEAAHLMLPWHEGTFLLDDKDRLSPGTKEQLEAEANLGAAHLLFQNGCLHDLAAEAGTGMSAALAVAPQFAASGHAALHYYAEHHPTEALALIVAGCYPRMTGLPVWRCARSPSFVAQFGDIGYLWPHGGLPTGPQAVFGEALADALTGARGRQRVTITDRGGHGRTCTAETWTNGRTIFVMVRAHQTRRQLLAS